LERRVCNRSEAGKLIVFEGPDGVGKSALAQCLFGQLKEAGVRSEYATFPGKRPGTIGQVVYEIHHDPGRYGIAELSQASLQALHIAAHLDAIERAIMPALGDGIWVILDRFWWSTWVYGCVSGVDRSVLDAMIGAEKTLWAAREPEVLFLIDRSNGPTNEEKEELRDAYRKLYAAEHSRYPVRLIRNDGSINDSVREIIAVLDELGCGIRDHTVLGG
jgi:dTMP kinase